MPHTTHAFGFEARVCGFAYEICARFTTGERERGRTFLVIFDRDGNVLSLSFADGSREWSENAWSIVRSEAPHLFYDPIDDGMEYIWLSWKGIDQFVMERLIGQRFEEADFQPIPIYARRARNLGPEKQLPQSWGVMF